MDSVEVLDIVKVDLEQFYKIVLVEITMKEGHSIREIEEAKNIEIISKITADDRSITCLMKGSPPVHLLSKIGKISENFAVDVIWDVPTRMKGKEIVMSAIGDEKDLNLVAKACKYLGSIEKISFSKHFLHDIDLLHCLTDKQKTILIEAKKRGYYEYPRKITSESLSRQLGISKATAIEHLRKAENRLMVQLLNGYH